MLKCDICDHEDDLISYDRQTGTFSPCGTCQAVIDDCIAGYGPEPEPEPFFEG